jgi:hypothetical protein
MFLQLIYVERLIISQDRTWYTRQIVYTCQVIVIARDGAGTSKDMARPFDAVHSGLIHLGLQLIQAPFAGSILRD